MRCTTYGTNQRWPESSTPLPPDDDTNVVRKSLWGRPFCPLVLLTQNTQTNFGRRPNTDFRWLVYKVLLQLGLMGPVLDWTIQTTGKKGHEGAKAQDTQDNHPGVTHTSPKSLY